MKGKKTYKPLQTLRFLSMHSLHPALQRCNIFKGNFRKIKRDTQEIRGHVRIC